MVFVNCLDVTRVEIVPELEAAKIALNVLVSPLILGVLDHGVNIQDLLCQEPDPRTVCTGVHQVSQGDAAQLQLLLVIFVHFLFVSLQNGLCWTLFVTQQQQFAGGL